jgi:hypothetical protein
MEFQPLAFPEQEGLQPGGLGTIGGTMLGAFRRTSRGFGEHPKQRVGGYFPLKATFLIMPMPIS